MLVVVLLCLVVPRIAHAETTDTSPFGFSCDNQTTYSLPTYCAQMARAGIRWIRGFPTFNVVEPAEGRFEWATVDTMLATAARNKMTISGLFLYGAPWIASGDGGLPVSNLAAWATYVSAVVTHCRGRVKYWEVWNETPNFIGKGTAEDYARTVVAAYDAAKKADPTCQIGLSIQSNNVYWIEQTIEAGARDHFDYIAVHPYEVLGLVETDGIEAEYMSIVPTLRMMLAARDPGRAKAPIWFTEIGYDAGRGDPAQANALVKAFTMGVAQGVTRIDWFEGKDGDSGPMGLLRADGTPRLAWTAMSTLTKYLGPTPRYLGWVLLNGRDYGFVFRGATTTVMATWARPGTTDRVSFGSRARIVDPQTGSVAAASACTLTGAPALVVGVPAALAKQAQANRTKPFPWGGDYTHAKSVLITMGDPSVEKGLHQLGADANSTAVTIYGGPARDCSKGAAQTFTVDPNFLSYATTPITVTVVVRGNAAKDNAGFNLKYESTTGWKGTGSWFTVPGNEQWYTRTWTITDARFVGKWGFNFALDSDSQAYSKYYLQSVTVSKWAAAGHSGPGGGVSQECYQPLGQTQHCFRPGPWASMRFVCRPVLAPCRV
jgi:hypothetical protein